MFILPNRVQFGEKSSWPDYRKYEHSHFGSGSTGSEALGEAWSNAQEFCSDYGLSYDPTTREDVKRSMFLPSLRPQIMCAGPLDIAVITGLCGSEGTFKKAYGVRYGYYGKDKFIEYYYDGKFPDSFLLRPTDSVWETVDAAYEQCRHAQEPWR